MSSYFKIKASQVHIISRCSLKNRQHLRSASSWSWDCLSVCLSVFGRPLHGNVWKSVYFFHAFKCVTLRVVFANCEEAWRTRYHNYAVVWVQRGEIAARDSHLGTTAEMTVPCNPRVPADVIRPPTCPQMIWRHLQLRVSTHPNSFRGDWVTESRSGEEDFTSTSCKHEANPPR